MEQVEGVSAIDYSHSGNFLLNQLLGARLHLLPVGQDLDAVMALGSNPNRGWTSAIRDACRGK